MPDVVLDGRAVLRPGRSPGQVSAAM